MPRRRRFTRTVRWGAYTSAIGLFLGGLTAAVLRVADAPPRVPSDTEMRPQQIAQVLHLDELPRGERLRAHWCLSQHRVVDDAVLAQCARLRTFVFED